MKYIMMAIAFLIAGITSASAQSNADRSTLSITWENDRWADTDRHYTNGIRFSYLSPETSVPAWVTRAAAYLPYTEPTTRYRYSLAFGQSMFTPEDIGVRSLITNDRPYAGWLYGEAGLIALSPGHTDTLTLSLGVVGESALAEPVQETVHVLTDSPDPSGWDNQLKDEPAIMLSYEREWPALLATDLYVLEADISPRVGGSVGNVFTQAAAGATMRLGFDLQADNHPPRIRPSLAGSDFFVPADGLSGYVFTGFEGRAVARNIFLDGNTWKDSHSVDREPWVWSAQAGMVLTYDDIRLSYSHVFMKEEFKQQTGDTQFGVITLSYSF